MLLDFRLLARGTGRLLLLCALAACAPVSAPPTSATVGLVTALITEPYPAPPGSATPDATTAAIIAAKATDAAKWAMTQSAGPTQTPPPATPTFPSAAEPCRASDLTLTDETQGATGTIVIVLRVTNISRSVCYMSGPADVKLLGAAGEPLDLVYSTHCFQCNNMDVLATKVPAPTQTADAQGRLHAQFGLGPGERLAVMALWNNWCDPLPTTGARAQLILPGTLGTLEATPNIPIAGRCDAPDAPSSLVVGEFARVP